MPIASAADGTIEVFEPPSRLVYTWHVLYDVEMSEEPPGRVEWTLTPANDDGSVTRVTLRHGDLAMSPKTWENVRIGWVGDHRQPEDAARDRRADARRSTPASALERRRGRGQVAPDPGRSTANNSTWELLDGRELTDDEADDLLGRAYAATYHWRRAADATRGQRRPCGRGSSRGATSYSARATWRCTTPSRSVEHVAGGR